MKLMNNVSKEEKKLIRKMFWRSGAMYASVNPVTMGGGGFCYSMIPFINHFYKDNEEKRREALVRHVKYFSTTIPMASFVMGIAGSMEKENSEKPDFDAGSINSIKLSLMGPLAGIGDSFFWGTLRIIAAGIGLSLAQQGSVLGAILFLIIFNVPHLLIRYYGTVLGYQFGAGLMSNTKSAGILKMISKGASIVGLMVIGAMSASMVAMKTPLTFTIGETAFELQGYLDQIFPLLLPLLYTLAMFGLLKKGCKSTTILLITIAVGVIGSLLHIL